LASAAFSAKVNGGLGKAGAAVDFVDGGHCPKVEIDEINPHGGQRR
jgi:hypothetical protein